LELYLEPEPDNEPPTLMRDTFRQLFSGRSEYMDLTGDKKRWARKELIELYIRNMKEQSRLKQIEQVTKFKQIGDGNAVKTI
ncbi:unnamed protein product, partial [marine sediment metagenome]